MGNSFIVCGRRKSRKMYKKLNIDEFLEKTSKENQPKTGNTNVKEPVGASCSSRDEQKLGTLFCTRCSRARPCEVCQILSLHRRRKAQRRGQSRLNGNTNKKALTVRSPYREQVHLPDLHVEEYFIAAIHICMGMFL